MTCRKLFASFAVAALAALAMPAAAAIARPADFQSEAKALVEAAFPAGGPGAAVIVTRGGRVVYAAGRGFADVEAGRPITPDTPFRLGSIAKQFTAAVVLQLVAEGRLSLDDPISRFFPDWPRPAAGATVRQLLNHSSGIQDFSKVPGWIARNRGRAWTTAQLLDVFRDLPVRALPGQAWEYNNGGYVLLGAIIEQVTGRTWHEEVGDRIARPLGLGTLAYSASEEVLAKAARGYAESDGRQEALELAPMSIAHAAGALVASVNDMAKWARALHHGEVVRPDLYKEMTSPARLADGSAEPYGFGLRLRRLRGRPAFVHGGAGGGLDTDSVYIPSEDLFVAVFANSSDPASDPSLLTRRLAALALGEPFPDFNRTEVAMAAIEPLFGAYHAKGEPPIRFFAREEKLYLGHGDQQMEAIPAGGDRFFFGDDRLMWIGFERRPDGGHVMTLNDPESAEPERAVRTGPVPPPLTLAAAVLKSYVGTYQTETVAVTIALSDDGRLIARAPGQPPMPMRPVSQTEFRLDGTPMRLVFHPENGAVDRFTLHRGARELHGRRTAP